MCEPISATTAIMIGLSAATTAASLYTQHETAKKQVAAINQQNEVQADEIAKAAGRELTDRAREAIERRAVARAAASEAGLNLNSGSFMAVLQASAMNQYNDQGTIIQNERGQQRARAARARSEIAGVQTPDYLAGALRIGASAYGTYANDQYAREHGTSRATGT